MLHSNKSHHYKLLSLLLSLQDRVIRHSGGTRYAIPLALGLLDASVCMNRLSKQDKEWSTSGFAKYYTDLHYNQCTDSQTTGWWTSTLGCHVSLRYHGIGSGWLDNHTGHGFKQRRRTFNLRTLAGYVLRTMRTDSEHGSAPKWRKTLTDDDKVRE